MAVLLPFLLRARSQFPLKLWPKLAIIGAVTVLATRCLDVEDAYKAVDWKILSLIFGMLAISIAMDMVKEGRADAFVSAGNTGAAVAAATLKLRTLPGVDRAGIASALPNEYGICHILDAGANPEAKPEHKLIPCLRIAPCS